MKRSQQLLLAFGLPVLLAGCATTPPTLSKAELLELTARFRPDARLAVFEPHIAVRDGKAILRVKTTHTHLRPMLEKRYPGLGIELQTLPDTQTLHGRTGGFVRVPVATLYGEPAYTGAVQTQAVHGDPVRILERAGSFLRVQVPDGYIAWIPREQVFSLDEAAWRKANSQPKLLVLDAETPVRIAASSQAQTLTALPSGSILWARGPLANGWRSVALAGGRQGFVQAQQVGDLAQEIRQWTDLRRNPTAFAKALSTLSKRYLGRSYQWAGTSSFAMDCSGFVQTVYRRMGRILPRDTDQQAKTGPVVEAPYRTGDLLFFGKKGAPGEKDRISHVALSLGGARFIHARGDVHTASLDPKDADFDPYEKERFLHAIRPAFERLPLIR